MACVRFGNVAFCSGSKLIILNVAAVVATFDLVEPPRELRHAAEDMRRRSGLAHPPPVYFVRSAGGHAGLHYQRANIVVVALDDCVDVARRIWHGANGDLARSLVLKAAGRVTMAVDQAFDWLWQAIVGRITAHEIGHAVVHADRRGIPYRNDEAAADWVAGALDALRSRGRQLGMVIFAEIGCVGSFCRHPGPAGRAHAYADGFDFEVSRQVPTRVRWA